VADSSRSTAAITANDSKVTLKGEIEDDRKKEREEEIDHIRESL